MSRRTLVLAAALLFLLCTVGRWRALTAAGFQRQAAAALRSGQYDEAARLSGAAQAALPNDAFHSAEHAAFLALQIDARQDLVRAALAGPPVPPDDARGPLAAHIRALARASADPGLLHTYGWLKGATGDAAGSRAAFEQAVLTTEDPVLWVAHALRLAADGEDPNPSLIHALAAGPSLADSPLFAALRREDPERLDGLLRSALNLLGEDGTPGNLARRGKLELSRGRLDAAEDHLCRALDVQPNLSRAWLNRGDVFLARGRAEDARRAYRIAVLTGVDRGLAAVRLGGPSPPPATPRASLAPPGSDTMAGYRERLHRGRRRAIDSRVPRSIHAACAPGAGGEWDVGWMAGVLAGKRP